MFFFLFAALSFVKKNNIFSITAHYLIKHLIDVLLFSISQWASKRYSTFMWALSLPLSLFLFF